MRYKNITAKIYKEKETEKPITINPEQVEEFKQDVVDLVEWSTNRIVDESKPACYGPGIQIKEKEEKIFSGIVKFLLAALFVGIGVLADYFLFSNWKTYWIGGVQNVAVIFMILLSFVCIALGISIFKEKDRNYIVAMFSAIVSLVALIVSLVR
ncbi:MAG: MFS transporter [Ruminococcaceae bacterium]|jgi:hypothetical protein|nr:MFS transporter [Oscillospiraceae bacterium]